MARPAPAPLEPPRVQVPLGQEARSAVVRVALERVRSEPAQLLTQPSAQAREPERPHLQARAAVQEQAHPLLPEPAFLRDREQGQELIQAQEWERAESWEAEQVAVPAPEHRDQFPSNCSSAGTTRFGG